MSHMAPEDYRPRACRFNGRGLPRTIPQRHKDDCPENSSSCYGCLECQEPHCRICVTRHTPGTCAECMAETREALHEIARMCGALPAEVEHRGIDGEAMFLLGPVADPEAIGHMEASVAVGRVPADYLAESTGGLHPLSILGDWDMQWRDALDHEDRALLEIAVTVDYLDTQMTYMGGYQHLDFTAFAMDLRRCRNHLEGVLHDGAQVDQGAPCMSCGARLERTWGKDEGGDGWRCPRCKQTSTDEQYRFAVMHLHREEAEWLTDRDMQIRTGVKAGTVRAWARPTSLRDTLVKKRTDQGRTVYCVADVMQAAKDRGMVA